MATSKGTDAAPRSEAAPRGEAAPRRRALVLIALHVLLLVYSLSGFFSKSAAAQPFMSPSFIALYGGMLVILAIYAIGWQQILKRLPLTVAFANKAITVVWGIVWGVLFFGEVVTWQMVLGAVIVIAGVVLFSIADGEEQAEAAKAEAAKAEAAKVGAAKAEATEAEAGKAETPKAEAAKAEAAKAEAAKAEAAKAEAAKADGGR